MAEIRRAQIKTLSTYFPEQIITNHDLEKIIDTNDEWIRERTGIRERRRSADHETPGFMGTEACRKILEKENLDPLEIDLVILATITADYPFPAAACVIQDALGAKKAWAFDLSAACSGFLYALDCARAFIESRQAEKILVVGAEKMSAILNYEDRNTCILFGDGAGACLVTESDGQSEILASLMKTDGSGIPFLYSPAGGSKTPVTAEMVKMNAHKAQQEGRAVYKRAVVDMAEVCLELLEREKVSPSEVKLLVPHQANLRIIESAAQRLGLPMDRVALNIDRFGNTTAATIPTALAQAAEQGQVQKGDLILLCSFGAGFTWGATLLRF